MFLAGIVVLSNLTLKPVPPAAPGAMNVLPEAAPMTQPAALKPIAVHVDLGLLETPMAALPSALPLAQAVRGVEAAGMSDMKVQASLDKMWDAEQEQEQHEEELVHVMRQERRAEDRHEMHAEFPEIDMVRFTESGAQDFAESAFDLGAEVLTGRELLILLLTPQAVVEGAALPRAADFPSFGRGEAQLRALSEERGLSYHQLSRALTQAHRYGLVYRLFDKSTGRTFHGVSRQARVALELTERPEAAAPAAPSAHAHASVFGERLVALAKKAETLGPKDELFEFTAQVAAAAVAARALASGKLPTAFAARMNGLALDASSVQNAALALVESADGTAWFQDAVALAEAGAAEGLIDAGELRQVLNDLR